MSPRMQASQPLRATCTSCSHSEKVFLVFRQKHISLVRIASCPVAEHRQKSPDSSFCTLPSDIGTL